MGLDLGLDLGFNLGFASFFAVATVAWCVCKLGLNPSLSGFAVASAVEPPSSEPATKPTEEKPTEEKPSEEKSSEEKSSESGKDKYAKPPATRFLPAAPPAEIKTERQLAEERKKREAARKQGEITFDDLKLDIEKGADFKSDILTKEVKELNKKVVKLRGFILPTSVFQQTGIKQFVLVRDNQECCFGPGAAIYDCVIVEMTAGKTTNFATRVVTVKGKFEIDTETYQYPDGGHYAIFKMTAEEVK